MLCYSLTYEKGRREKDVENYGIDEKIEKGRGSMFLTAEYMTSKYVRQTPVKVTGSKRNIADILQRKHTVNKANHSQPPPPAVASLQTTVPPVTSPEWECNAIKGSIIVGYCLFNNKCINSRIVLAPLLLIIFFFLLCLECIPHVVGTYSRVY